VSRVLLSLKAAVSVIIYFLMLTFPGYCEWLLPYLECRTCATEVQPFVTGTPQQTVLSDRVVYSLNKQTVNIVWILFGFFVFVSIIILISKVLLILRRGLAVLCNNQYHCSFSIARCHFSVDSNFHVLAAVISDLMTALSITRVWSPQISRLLAAHTVAP